MVLRVVPRSPVPPVIPEEGLSGSAGEETRRNTFRENCNVHQLDSRITAIGQRAFWTVLKGMLVATLTMIYSKP